MVAVVRGSGLRHSQVAAAESGVVGACHPDDWAPHDNEDPGLRLISARADAAYGVCLPAITRNCFTLPELTNLSKAFFRAALWGDSSTSLDISRSD